MKQEVIDQLERVRAERIAYQELIRQAEAEMARLDEAGATLLQDCDHTYPDGRSAFKNGFACYHVCLLCSHVVMDGKSDDHLLAYEQKVLERTYRVRKDYFDPTRKERMLHLLKARDGEEPRTPRLKLDLELLYGGGDRPQPPKPDTPEEGEEHDPG